MEIIAAHSIGSAHQRVGYCTGRNPPVLESSHSSFPSICWLNVIHAKSWSNWTSGTSVYILFVLCSTLEWDLDPPADHSGKSASAVPRSTWRVSWAFVLGRKTKLRKGEDLGRGAKIWVLCYSMCKSACWLKQIQREWCPCVPAFCQHLLNRLALRNGHIHRWGWGGENDTCSLAYQPPSAGRSTQQVMTTQTLQEQS